MTVDCGIYLVVGKGGFGASTKVVHSHVSNRWVEQVLWSSERGRGRGVNAKAEGFRRRAEQVERGGGRGPQTESVCHCAGRWIIYSQKSFAHLNCRSPVILPTIVYIAL